MNINKSKVTFSSIVGIGEKVKKASEDENVKYLALNRGVNAVVNIDLTKAISRIDHNSSLYQTYSPNSGIVSLRHSIMKSYFPSQGIEKYKNVTIMPGGMPGLDLIIQTLNVENLVFPKFYWGSYSKMADIRGKSYEYYDNILTIDINNYNSNHCIFICDPNNPTGIKVDDHDLYYKIRQLSETGATIIFDCPYRKLFEFDDDMDLFDAIVKLPNVIVCESFSKSLGISGARLGFIYSSDEEFNTELAIRTLYQFNGVCTPSQLLVNELLTTCTSEVRSFQRTTTRNIVQNINYLTDRDLLATEVYGNDVPHGMFAIINITESELFKHKIGAVSLDKFTADKQKYSKYSRICLSVLSEEFKQFFDNVRV
jgi:aspartate/methionine/tyrosine aminotransferase